MRRIVTWSVRGRHPWIVIAIWVVVAGALSVGRTPERDHNDASKGLSNAREQARRRLQQRPSPTPRDAGDRRVQLGAPLTTADKAAIAQGQAWLKSGVEPMNSASVQYSPDGKGALIFASLNGNPGDAPSATRCRPSATTSAKRSAACRCGSPAPAAHHRRLQDLPQRRRQAADRHGHPRARAAPAHLPLAGPALRPSSLGFGYFVAGGILALVAKATARRSRARPPRSW